MKIFHEKIFYSHIIFDIYERLKYFKIQKIIFLQRYFFSFLILWLMLYESFSSLRFFLLEFIQYWRKEFFMNISLLRIIILASYLLWHVPEQENQFYDFCMFLGKFCFSRLALTCRYAWWIEIRGIILRAAKLLQIANRIRMKLSWNFRELVRRCHRLSCQGHTQIHLFTLQYAAWKMHKFISFNVFSANNKFYFVFCFNKNIRDKKIIFFSPLIYESNHELFLFSLANHKKYFPRKLRSFNSLFHPFSIDVFLHSFFHHYLF